VGTLVHGASELLREGQPRKALVLLQRARSLDSTQLEVDRLRALCRARLGLWVPDGSEADWMPGDDRLATAVRDDPDSMAKVGRKLIEAENLAGAVQVFGLLSASHAATQAFLNAYREARARQEMKVAFHLDLAKRAMARGALSEAGSQWRLAWSARPDDPLLRELVEKSDESLRATLKVFEKDLRTRLAARDEDGSIEVLRKARVAFPDMGRFQKAQDSLVGARRVNLLARLEQISAMVDAGNEGEAMEAMERLGESDPTEPLLAQAQDLLQQRIQKRRRRGAMDSLARSCGEAIQSGDVSKAEGLYAELVRDGVDADIDSRLRPRLDSLRSVDRAASAFQQAMAAARRALARGDVPGGRAAVQKALVAKPDNALAKTLLANLATPRSTAPSARPSMPVAGATPPPPDQNAQKIQKLLLSGVTAYRAGEYEKAMAQWKLVLALDSNCVQAQKYLANVGRKQARLK